VTHEDECGVEVFVVLLDIVCIVLGRLLLVHGVEVDAGIVGLDGREKRSQGILEATLSQQSRTRTMERVKRTTLNRFVVAGIPFHSFRSFQHHP